MLARPAMPSAPLARPQSTCPPDWDVFCRVIDNLGDIGVCWRLARQLAAEHGLRVRLWVDALDSFRLLCPTVSAELSIQHWQGVEIHRWTLDFPEVSPAAVVLETFACHLPESFVERMARQSPPPVWINLDYLSAEEWVSDWHALPSPHPRLPLVKHFFFPGFTRTTGGLLRERDLPTRRQEFADSAAQQLALWNDIGFAPPPADTRLVSLFAYDKPAISDLLGAWEASPTPICCLAPLAGTLPAIEAHVGKALRAGDRFRRGALDLRIVPFLEQSRYDQLLWLCDLNFVRGEDSFVRAQWAARPMIWQIYPQQDEAHRRKLDAFLRLYCADLPVSTASALGDLWRAWNFERVTTSHWQSFAASLGSLRQHARHWAGELARQDDLCSRLLCFRASQL